MSSIYSKKIDLLKILDKQYKKGLKPKEIDEDDFYPDNFRRKNK